MAKSDFVEVFGGVYEHSPWIAAQAWSNRLTSEHDTASGLHGAMAAVVDAADHPAKLELLRAHPDLAGKLAVRGELTDDSTSEQAGAGLDQCSAAEFAEFQALNERYKAKFEFPFILAVRGRGRGEILDNFRRRVDNDVEAEFAEALRQVHRIAALRLNQID
jgi:OHCU decarboxylase